MEKKKKHPKWFKDYVKDKGSQMGKKLIIEDLNYKWNVYFSDFKLIKIFLLSHTKIKAFLKKNEHR